MAARSGFVDNWQSGRSVVECNRHMLTSEHNSDVTFRVGKGEKPIRTHRYVLKSRSCVFDAMLCGPQAEKDDIKMSDVEADIFSDMLVYLYTDDATVTPGNVTGLLYLAKKYAIGGLVTLCLTHLENCLSPENACLILEHAHRFDEEDLYDKACKVVLQHGDTCFATESFKNLCHDCFDNVLKSGDLTVQPQNAFKAATVWAEAECGRKGREITPKNLRSILGETVYGIPFISMEKDYYVKNVVPRGILTDAENVKIMSCFLCPEKDPSPIGGRKIPMYQPVQPSYSLLCPSQSRQPTPQTVPHGFPIRQIEQSRQITSQTVPHGFPIRQNEQSRQPIPQSDNFLGSVKNEKVQPGRRPSIFVPSPFLQTVQHGFPIRQNEQSRQPIPQSDNFLGSVKKEKVQPGRRPSIFVPSPLLQTVQHGFPIRQNEQSGRPNP
ncbi:BTB/POZ domain-containing protein 3-like [Haliotis cracherodii]|uniref:BTB/POZ domain-containing protein 3-like n=1 Tax=Haliotis cracherodii TaxID=6455 RepID=UPI0039EA1E2C